VDDAALPTTLVSPGTVEPRRAAAAVARWRLRRMLAGNGSL
jgi:hypothetical protein